MLQNVGYFYFAFLLDGHGGGVLLIAAGRSGAGRDRLQSGYPPDSLPPYKFARHGRSGAWVSEVLPHMAGVVDELCFVKSLHTEAINHDHGMTIMTTGSQQPGRPSIGGWLSYGLGRLLTANEMRRPV